jgi:hypothetical protein
MLTIMEKRGDNFEKVKKKVTYTKENSRIVVIRNTIQKEHP